MDSHDGFLFSLAEHNFVPTAAWKSMLDWISRTVPNEPADSGWKKTFNGKFYFNYRKTLLNFRN